MYDYSIGNFGAGIPSVVTGLCGLGVVGLKQAGDFFFFGGGGEVVKHISLVLGPTQPPAHLVPGVQQPGDETDH